MPLTVATVFCNVGFLAMARSADRGEPVSVLQGLRCAAGLLPTILLWSLLTWSVGALLSLLQEIPGIGGVIGRVAGWLGGLAWGLATFFVVPVLVVERQGTLASVRTSARTFRRRWGEAVTADVGIGTVIGFAMLPGFGLVVAGIAISSMALTLAGLLWVAPLLALESALSQLFTLQLYCEDSSGPFAASDLSAAVRPR